MKLVFGEWTPDLPDFGNPGSTEAKNVIPGTSSYLQMPSPVVYSDALTTRCQGMVSSRDNDGTAFTFAGDSTYLYHLQGDATWDDISGTILGNGNDADNYAAGSDQRWQWAQFGEQVLAFNKANYPQTYTMGTSSLFSDLTLDLKAKTGAQVRDFIMCGNTWDSVDGTVPHRVRWSAVGDPTDYTVSSVTQSDYQDLDASGGYVQKIIGGEYAAVFQEKAIYRVTYTGSATIFDFDRVEEKRGTPAPGSVVKFGDLIAFLSDDGFYVFDGNNSAPISHNKISQTFYRDVNSKYLDRIESNVDYSRQLIIWSYPSSESTGGECDKILMYSYAPESLMRWSWAEISTQTLGHVVTGSYTLEQLDNISTSIEDIPLSFDSRYWAGNNDVLAAFNSDNKLITFTGDGLDAVLESTEADAGGVRTMFSKLRPLIDGGSTVTIQIGTRNKLQDSTTWGPERSVQSSGNIATRSTGLYHKVRVNISGGFTNAQGVEVLEASKRGDR